MILNYNHKGGKEEKWTATWRKKKSVRAWAREKLFAAIEYKNIFKLKDNYPGWRREFMLENTKRKGYI